VDDVDLLGSKYLIEGGRKFGIVIMKEITHRWLAPFDRPTELPGLLRDPSGSGMFGTTDDLNTASSQLDEEEDIHRLPMQRFDGEEIAREQLLSIVVQKRPPRTLTALGRGQEMMAAQDVLDSRWIDDETEFQQLALDFVVPHARFSRTFRTISASISPSSFGRPPWFGRRKAHSRRTSSRCQFSTVSG